MHIKEVCDKAIDGVFLLVFQFADKAVMTSELHLW